METIGFIGSGNMAEAMINGVLKGSVYRPGSVYVSDVRPERLDYLRGHYGVRIAASNAELASQVVRLAAERLDDGIVGLDLAGNEVAFPSAPFESAFHEAKEAGLHITVHAGEWGGAGNVAAAITQLGAERIGHGVRVVEDPAVVALARDRNVAFEVCLTSNYQSGVVNGLHEHPMADMLSKGLNVTLNTDDPSISQITLGDEYCLACEYLGLSLEALRERLLTAAGVAFIPQNERQRLVERLTTEFPQISEK